MPGWWNARRGDPAVGSLMLPGAGERVCGRGPGDGAARPGPGPATQPVPGRPAGPAGCMLPAAADPPGPAVARPPVAGELFASPEGVSQRRQNTPGVICPQGVGTE